ncbi:MAG TPA: thermonuclease family protein [Steroidobacteraceae bacterium]|nr:thermonuclease family protein [Steroidobacteraceae bacterium]
MRAIRILLLALCLLAWLAAAEEITGTVIKVFDGDSFIVTATSGGQVEIRLAGIDAPEKNQPYADNARAALRGLVLDRKLRFEVLDVDRYGRKVAHAYRESDRLDINAELVRRGHVWVYRRRAYDASLYDLERDARAQKLGLWALPESEREPPWRWRRTHPPEHHSTTPDQKAPSPAASMSR